MKTLLFYFLLLFSYNALAQKHKQDVVLDSTTYHYVSFFPNGKMKEVSEHLTEKEGGKWVYFNSDGDEIWRGSYNKKGNKEGEWWHKKVDIIVYKNGKEIKKGIGCDPCPY